MNNRILKQKTFLKLLMDKPHYSHTKCEQLSERLINAEKKLIPNLLEWTEGRPLSDIYVRDKYCIGAVLKLRGSTDFVSAFLALDSYAKDENNEPFLWQTRK